MHDYSTEMLTYFSRLKNTIDNLSLDKMNTLIALFEEARQRSKTIFIMGNGGSASTASHYVCDFNKGLVKENQKRYRFICLNDNVPSILAYANDVSYDDIFIEQLKNHLSDGDLVLGISGSGNSKNIIKAINYAKENGGKTIGLTGYDGGVLGATVQTHINVPIHDMQIAEDIHIIINHCIMTVLYQKG